MDSKPCPHWQHPWLRISLILRIMLTRPWSAAQWRLGEPEIPKVLALQRRIRRVGWFN